MALLVIPFENPLFGACLLGGIGCASAAAIRGVRVGGLGFRVDAAKGWVPLSGSCVSGIPHNLSAVVQGLNDSREKWGLSPQEKDLVPCTLLFSQAGPLSKAQC